MPPELTARIQPAAWPMAARTAALLGVVWLALLAAFASDWADMARQWWFSSTYEHMVLVPPIIAWLAWQRRAVLSSLAPHAWAPGLIVVAGALALWLLGAVAGINLLRQAGAVALLPASALVLFGPRLAAAFAFPLAYLVFLVPFGDEFVAPLQTLTARIVVALTRLSGVPVSLDGVFITTPAGLFKVAEACSGLKFLVAMAALATLAAQIGFVGWRRRVLFVVAALLAAVLANGIRAWATIIAAQWVGAERATGFDHIVYGWVFFAAVIGVVLAAAWRYFDRPANASPVDLARLQQAALFDRLEQAGPKASSAALIGAIALLVLGTIAWARTVDRLAAPMPAQIALPDVPGWHRVDYAPAVAWQPQATGADHRLLGRYADQAGHRVDVFYALYASQREGKEAGGFGEGAVTPQSGWAWASDAPSPPGCKVKHLLAGGKLARTAQTCYRSGQVLTGSEARLKLATIADRLLLRARPTAMLILSAEGVPGNDPAAALGAFNRAMGPAGPWMDRIARIG